MNKLVVDASAVLAFILKERGGEAVSAHIPDIAISTVNVAEVVAKLCDGEVSDDDVRLTIEDLDLDIVQFDGEMAFDSGLLRRKTRHVGLSLGDRACLALARRLGLPALTADRRWAELDVGVEVRLIR